MDGNWLRIEIDGYWTSGDFAKLFAEMEMLNEFAQFGELTVDGQSAISLRLSRSRRIRENSFWPFDYEAEVEAETAVAELLLKGVIRDYTGLVNELQVKRVSFASPGFVDLLGAGKVIGHISKFILGVTDRWIAREDRELARDHKRQTILKQKITNAENLLKLSKKAGLDPDTRRQMVRRVLESDSYFETKMLDGKITDVYEVNEGPRGRS